MSNDLEIIADGFSEVTLENGICAWIDVLGTKASGFDRSRVEKLLDTATIVSSKGELGKDGKYYAVSNALANITVVSDAICVSQKVPDEDYMFARDGVSLVATFISNNLFMQGVSHRGAIAQGSLDVGSRHGIRFTTGSAVVAAIQAEAGVKTTGLVVCSDLWTEALHWRVPSAEDPYIFHDVFGHKYITFKDHEKNWKDFCEKNKHVHAYIAASLAIFKN